MWVVKRARDEHKQAVEWLNQHTDEDIGFFLLEIELWKINDSLPAPKFNVVERPNDWAKTMKAVEGLSDTKKLQLEFWKGFNDYAFSKAEFKSVFSKRKPQAQHWYDLTVGSSIYRVATKDCRILALNNGDIKKGETAWSQYYDWYCCMALKLREILKKYDV